MAVPTDLYRSAVFDQTGRDESGLCIIQYVLTLSLYMVL